MSHLAFERYFAFLAGEASPTDRAHVDDCAQCRAGLEKLRSARALVGDTAAPSAFIKKRAERMLLADIAAHQTAVRRRPAPMAVAAIALVAAFSSAAAAYYVARRAAPMDESAAGASLPLQSLKVTVPKPMAISISKRKIDAAKPAKQKVVRVAPSTCSAAWMSQPGVAAKVAALCSSRGGEAALWLQKATRSGAASVEDVLAEIAKADGARTSVEGMRLGCEWGLKYRGDAAAVEACRAFRAAHPGHHSIPLLMGAAALVAERNGAYDDAESLFSQAVLHAHGVVGASALFGRARVRTRLGDIAGARSDLQLYLSAEPGAQQSDRVRALMDELGL